MNGINSKDRFSFAKGYRARTIFLIFDILLLGILMCMMVLPLLKVIVDSIDPTSYGVRLWPRKIDFSAYEMILTTSSLYRPFLVSVLTTVVGTVTGLFIITMGAYVLIQKDMPGHVLMGRMVLFTMMFSGGMIPTHPQESGAHEQHAGRYHSVQRFGLQHHSDAQLLCQHPERTV